MSSRLKKVNNSAVQPQKRSAQRDVSQGLSESVCLALSAACGSCDNNISETRTLSKQFSTFIHAGVLILLFVIISFRGEIPARAETASQNPDKFLSFLESMPLPSGEMTVAVTDYYSSSLPQARQKTPGMSTYYAVWNGADILLMELTPGLSNRTNSVTGLLVGRQGNLLWHAVGTQLNLFIKTDDAIPYDPAADNNTVNYLVQNAHSMVGRFLKGGYDFENMNWKGTHLSARVEGVLVDAELEFGTNYQRLSGSAEKDGMSGHFRIEYLDWGALGRHIYPRRYDEYLKFEGDKDFKKMRSFDIVSLKSPLLSVDSYTFSPQAQIDTNYFSSYIYVSNSLYLITTNKLIKVRPALPSHVQTPVRTFIILILLFSAIFLPLALWLGLKNNKPQTQTNK